MLKLDFGKPVMEIIAKSVQREANRCAEKMTASVLNTTPIWTGVMINSWQWSHNEPVFKVPPVWGGVMVEDSNGNERPSNPLPRPGFEDVTPNFTFGKVEFPTMYLTCSVDYAWEVDQGAGRYASRRAREMVKHALESV